MMREAFFQLPGAAWSLQLSKDVVQFLDNHAQRDSFAAEAVGQLYSRDVTAPVVVIERATKLQPKSASRVKVKFDTIQAYAERKELFESGLHCVGLWHTHPEPNPSPSGDDRRLARDYALNAKSHVNGIVFAIAGTRALPDGLRIWFDDGIDLLLATRIDVPLGSDNSLSPETKVLRPKI